MDSPVLTGRSQEREIMDESAPDPVLLAQEFRYLRTFNRATAAHQALVQAVVARLAPSAGAEISLVDLGTGSGDLPTAFARLATAHGWQATCCGVDSSDQVLAIARAQPRRAPVEFRQADIRNAHETLGERSFDVAHASLVLHHLSDADVVRALASMGRTARRLVVWNDLVRDRAGVLGARAATLFASRALRHDAVASVRRSFSLHEAVTLAEAAGLTKIGIARVRGARFVLVAEPAPTHTTSMVRPLLRAEGLGFSHGTHVVLRDLSLEVRAGGALVVSGPNGCGKSTLLALLAGALRPATGRAWVDRAFGAPGYHPQQGGLMSQLDVAANVAMCAQIAGVSRRDCVARVRATLERFGLATHASTPVSQLSGGLIRRTALAATFVHRPCVLVLDEPDAGLDAAGRLLLVSEIASVVRGGGAAILASHDRTWAAGIHAADGSPAAERELA